MSVAARFWVQSIKKSAIAGDSVSHEAILQPVIRPSGLDGADGNVQWSKYTPSGEIRLVITNEAAGKWFEARIGQDVAISFDDPA